MRSNLLHRRALQGLAVAVVALLTAACGASNAAHGSSTTTSSAPTTSATPVTQPIHHHHHKSTTTTLAGSPAPAASCSVPPLRKAAPGLVAGRVTAVGDSVMIDLEPYLQSDVKGIDFDAVVGQQWYSGISDVQQLRSDGQLGAIVVIELGTNGPITTELFNQMMGGLQGVSRVVFVTNYVPDSYENANNAIIEAGAARYRNVAVANWYALATAHPGWLCPDGYHLSCGGPGAKEMAALITRCV
jgi:hypothetical protein